MSRNEAGAIIEAMKANGEALRVVQLTPAYSITIRQDEGRWTITEQLRSGSR